MEEEELLELAKEFDSIYLCRETARFGAGTRGVHRHPSQSHHQHIGN